MAPPPGKDDNDMNEFDVYEIAKRIVVFTGFGVIVGLGIAELLRFTGFLIDMLNDQLFSHIKEFFSR